MLALYWTIAILLYVFLAAVTAGVWEEAAGPNFGWLDWTVTLGFAALWPVFVPLLMALVLLKWTVIAGWAAGHVIGEWVEPLI